MRRQTGRWFLVGGLFLFVTTALWFNRRQVPANGGNPASSPVPAGGQAGRSGIPAGRLAFNWPPGTHCAYGLEFSTEAILEQRGDSQTVIRATYHTLVLDDPDDSGRIHMVTILTDAEYRLPNRRAGPLEDLFEQVPCLIEFDRSGRIRRIILPQYIKGEDAAMLRGLNSTQAVLPGRRSSKWQTEEADENGEVAVAYTLTGPGTLRKQRLRYTKLEIMGVESPSDIAFRESSFDVRLGSCWIDRYTGGETISYSAGGAEVFGIRHNISMEKLDSGQPLPPALKALKGMSAEQVIAHLGGDSPPIIREAGAESVSSIARRLTEGDDASGLSFGDAMKAIRDALAADDDSGRDIAAIKELARLLRKQPQHAFEVLKVLGDNPEISPRISAALIHALELSGGNPESQQVLAAIAGDFKLERFNEQMVAQAAFAAGGLGEVRDEALMNNLFRLAFGEIDARLDRARDNSVLSLGILSKFFPEMRKALADEFHRILSVDDPSMVSRKMTALMSMENGAIKDPRLEELAKDLFERSPDVGLRVCALEYLGTDDKHLRLAKNALGESREEIQRAGVDALANREQVDEESVGLMLGLLNDSARSEDLRCHIAFRLDGLRDTHPSIKPAFESLVRQLEQPGQSLSAKPVRDGSAADGLLGALKSFLSGD